MTWLWTKFRSKLDHYEINKLIDFQKRESLFESSCVQNIICDIDKTYLETEFDSIVDIAKIAFEDAHEKQTVLGAGEVLHQLRWNSVALQGSESPLPLHFVSSSPPQLRAVLEEKFLIDDLDWSSETFKNQAYNLKKIRMHLIKHQVLYKTKAIVDLMLKSAAGSPFCLIGDNAESDPFIYLGLHLVTNQTLSHDDFAEFLESAGVEVRFIHEIINELVKLNGQYINCILIRKLKDRQHSLQPPLTESIFYFNDFLDAALQLILNDILTSDSIWSLVRHFHNKCDYPLNALYKRVSDFSHLAQVQNNASFDLLERLDRELKSLNITLTPTEEVNEVEFFNSFSRLQTLKSLEPSELASLLKKWVKHSH